jgi:hypothetical protein
MRLKINEITLNFINAQAPLTAQIYGFNSRTISLAKVFIDVYAKCFVILSSIFWNHLFTPFEIINKIHRLMVCHLIYLLFV